MALGSRCRSVGSLFVAGLALVLSWGGGVLRADWEVRNQRPYTFIEILPGTLSPQDPTVLAPYQEVGLDVAAGDVDQYDMYNPQTQQWIYNENVGDSVNYGETADKFHICWAIASGPGSLPYGCYGLWEDGPPGDPYDIPECFQHRRLVYRAGDHTQTGHAILRVQIDDNDFDGDPNDPREGWWVRSDDGLPLESDVSIWVIEVASLSWQKYGDNDDLDGCPNNGGMRIFPEKKTPGDTADYRNKVNLKITLSDPVPEGKTVYVHAFLFDVDDPKYTGSPVDPETPVAYNDNQCNNRTSQGSDRGANFNYAGLYNKWYIFNGGEQEKSQVVAIDDRRPGNNWKAVASTRTSGGWVDAVHLAANGQTFVDANNQEVPAQCISPMLTVWRTLWVESDTMQPDENMTNKLFGSIASATYDGSTWTHLLVDPVPGDFNEANHFIAGKILVQGEASPWSVLFFNPNNDVSVYGDKSFAEGKNYLLVDDDHDLTNASLPMLVQYPRLADTSWLESRLHQVYMVPSVNTTSSTNIPFDRNVHDDEFDSVVNTDFQWKDFVCGAFRAVHLVSAHQPRPTPVVPPPSWPDVNYADGDPISEVGALGLARSQVHGAMVFLEVIRDDGDSSESRTVAHEIGHCLGADDWDGQLMDPGNGDDYFSPTSINKIRKKSWP